MRVAIWVLARLQSCQILMWVGFLRRHKSRILAFRQGARRAGTKGDSCVWFHAASLGELEMVRPLMDDLISKGTAVGVSVFSESALPGLSELMGRTVYAGLSPREDLWESWFDFYGVRKVILSKYDFWPGLLRSARKRAAPVVVVNAEWRASLERVLWLFRWMREPLPVLKFLVNAGEVRSLDELRGRFGSESVMASMNPRFERVRRRIDASTRGATDARIAGWRTRIGALPRPVLMVGSAWLEDLRFLIPELRKVPISLVVVPHVLEPGLLGEMRDLLERDLPGRAILVPEMGILVELYGTADRAFVGGGFGKGIHSTLEPAVCGLPTACGPTRIERFPETRELRMRGALSVCDDSTDLARWLSNSAPGRLSRMDLENLVADYQRLLEQCL